MKNASLGQAMVRYNLSYMKIFVTFDWLLKSKTVVFFENIVAKTCVTNLFGEDTSI